MNDGGVASVKPPIAHATFGGFRIVVVTRHDDVAAGDDLARRLAVGGNIAALVVDDTQLAGGNQLHALPRLDLCAGIPVALRVLRARLVDADRPRRLTETVTLDHALLQLV